MTKVLITGAKGFIGSALLEYLKLSDQFEVFTTDKVSGETINYTADIKDEKSLEFIVDLAPQVIVHLAAQSSVPSSLSDPIEDLTVNALGTLNLVRTAISAEVQNFIYVNSGGAIYGSKNLFPLRESSAEYPESPYAISKLTGEFITRQFASAANMGWTSLALSNCYGPVDINLKGVIYEFHKCLINKVQPEIFGSQVTRDFIYIDDVLEAIKLAIIKPVNCRVHISSGSETSLAQLYENICQILQVEVIPIIGPPIIGQVLNSCLDNGLALELLGWKPRTTLDKGLRLSLLGYRD
jgi:UDP-glucose 4-epimerase